MTRTKRTKTEPAAAAPWSRRRLATIVTLVVLVVVLGVILWVRAIATEPEPLEATQPQQSSAPVPRGSSARDVLAAVPMATVPDGAAFPQPVTTTVPERISIPPAVEIDEFGVAVGFPQTPEGAVGQLAAIDQAALSMVDLAQPRRVITAWAAPDGPTPESWSTARGMAELLSAARLPAGSASEAYLSYTPSMGQIKGVVGTDFVVACVNGEAAFTLQGRTERIAAADCQRMVWESGRWVIGPGPEPVTPPSAWPGSQVAVDAGWKELDYVG